MEPLAALTLHDVTSCRQSAGITENRRYGRFRAANATEPLAVHNGVICKGEPHFVSGWLAV